MMPAAYTRILALLFGAIGLTIVTPASAQRAFFNQPNTNPLVLNPAFTGTAGTHRLTASTRIFWPDLEESSAYYNLNYDTRVSFIRGGIGIVSNLVRTFNDQDEYYNGITYAYAIDLGDQSRLMTGAKLGVMHIRRRNVRFASPDGPLPPVTLTKTVPDVSAGVVLQSHGFNAGVAINHLNTPNVSVFEGFESELHMLLSVHGSYDWNVSEDVTLAPFLRFDYQDEASRAQLMVTGNYRWVYLGAGYDGDLESFTGLAGVCIKNQLRINYSLDYSTADFRSFSDTGGIHEVSLQWVVGGQPEENQRFNTIAF